MKYFSPPHTWSAIYLVSPWIYFALFTLGSNVLVLGPREITHFVRARTTSSALYPSPKGLSHSRYMYVRASTEANGSHFRYFKQRIKRMDWKGWSRRKEREGCCKGTEGWSLDQKQLTSLSWRPGACSHLCVRVETGAFDAGSTQEVLSQAGLERIKKGCPFPGLLESRIIPAPLRLQQLPSKPGLFCLPHAVVLPTCTSS